MKTYAAYRFRTKDPAIDEFRTIAEDHFGHRVTKKDCQAIEEAGGPTAKTVAEWFFGETLRPQNPTLEAAGRALGYRREWVKMNAKDK
jgi:hypothetical protein